MYLCTIKVYFQSSAASCQLPWIRSGSAHSTSMLLRRTQQSSPRSMMNASTRQRRRTSFRTNSSPARDRSGGEERGGSWSSPPERLDLAGSGHPPREGRQHLLCSHRLRSTARALLPSARRRQETGRRGSSGHGALAKAIVR